jgi:hypothetical protein
VDEDKGRNVRRLGERQPEGDEAAERVANHRGAFDPHSVQKPADEALEKGG